MTRRKLPPRPKSAPTPTPFVGKLNRPNAWSKLSGTRLALADIRVDYGHLGVQWEPLNAAARKYRDERLNELTAMYGMVSSAPQVMIAHAAVAWASAQWLHAMGMQTGDTEMVTKAMRLADSAAKHEKTASELLAHEARVSQHHTGTAAHGELLAAFIASVPDQMAAELDRRALNSAAQYKRDAARAEREAAIKAGRDVGEVYAKRVRGRPAKDKQGTQGPWHGTGTIRADGTDAGEDGGSGGGEP